jgi:predicted dehydrogenase
VRLGIVGCGAIGAKRALAAKGHIVSVVCDSDASRSQALASSIGAAVAREWQDVVQADLDAIVVATTHDALAPIGLAALQHGKHVLIEKPGARTASELQPLAAEARQRGLVAKVGFNHRFHPALLKASRLVREGAIGPTLFVRGRYGHGGRPGYSREWRFQREISGGGELLDQGSHLIDLARWFLGDLRVEYGKLPTYYWGSGVEDNCFLALSGPEGQTAWLHASWTEWKNTFCFEVFGRDGKLVIDGLGGSYGTERLTYYRMLPQLGPPETTIWEFPFGDTSWETEFTEFAAAVAENRDPIGSVDDAIAVLQMVDALYERCVA